MFSLLFNHTSPTEPLLSNGVQYYRITFLVKGHIISHTKKKSEHIHVSSLYRLIWLMLHIHNALGQGVGNDFEPSFKVFRILSLADHFTIHLSTINYFSFAQCCSYQTRNACWSQVITWNRIPTATLKFLSNKQRSKKNPLKCVSSYFCKQKSEIL